MVDNPLPIETTDFHLNEDGRIGLQHYLGSLKFICELISEKMSSGQILKQILDGLDYKDFSNEHQVEAAILVFLHLGNE